MSLSSISWRLAAIAILVAGSVFALVPRTVKERSYDPATGLIRDTTVRRVPINMGLDLRGGTHLVLEVDESKGRVADCADAIRRAERVVRTRINEFGTSEPVVQVVGDCRLIVEIAGESDPGRAKAIVQRTAFLEFRITDTKEQFRQAIPTIDAALRRAGVNAVQTRPDINAALFTQPTSDSTSDGRGVLSAYLAPGRVPGEFVVAEADVATVERLLGLPALRTNVPRGIDLKWGSENLNGYRALYALEARPIITGQDVRQATAGRDPMTSESEVQFELSRSGGRAFGQATERNVGNHLAILLDGRVQGQPPVIQERIDATGRIQMGGKTLEEANDLALVLRAGALPAPLRVIEDRTIGASLGSDSTHAGVRASILAVLFVLVVMGSYYGRAGLLAVGALFFYVLFCAGALALFGFDVTLPGLAGFALSIGMAVDANVLIFERMREELAKGKTIRRALDEGFSNAMGAIIDSNVTTALTALVLYMVGTGPVQGFAITLLVGIVASMVSAIFITRTLFLLWLQRPNPPRMLPRYQLFAKADFDFIRFRRWAYAISAAIVLPGLIWLALRGATYSIEFTGGALLQIETAAPTQTSVLRSALQRGGLPGAEIQNFGSEREFVIRARLGADHDRKDTDAIVSAARKALNAELGVDGYSVKRGEGVGPKVGSELQQKAVVAILFSFVTTLIYLAFRFEWRFGVAAVIATAHDVLATIAFIRYLDLEVGLVVVAAVLTILGYSLNDTIVIFDRVRENLRGTKRNFVDVLNRSINETLPRTILTGGTTLATAFVLAFFAGEVIKPFALVMAFGIVMGTFSSIYVASPVLLWIHQRFPATAHRRKPRGFHDAAPSGKELPIASV
jgi:protein-export membrane protein SecD/preprotein translocase SecF subunit